MKELHFERRGRMHIATEGNLRFVLRPGKKMSKGFEGEIYKRDSKRKEPWLSGHFSSKAQAIDWMARYRQPQDEKVRVG